MMIRHLGSSSSAQLTDVLLGDSPCDAYLRRTPWGHPGDYHHFGGSARSKLRRPSALERLVQG